MLYQELPRLNSTPLDKWERWLLPALIGAAALTAALVMLVAGHLLIAGTCLLVGALGAAFSARKAPDVSFPTEQIIGAPDYSLVGSALGLSSDPIALTNGEGSLLIVNSIYRQAFGSLPPHQLGTGEEALDGLKLAQTMAWRDGAGCVARIETSVGPRPVEVERVGSQNDLLLWRFPSAPPADPLAFAIRRVEGLMGERLTSAGVMAAVVDGTGTVVGANGLFTQRALTADQSIGRVRFGELVEIDQDEQMRLVSEGDSGLPMRAVHMAADMLGESGAGTFLLFETGGNGSVVQSSNLQALLDVLPIGLALVDRDGRFLTVNSAFQ